MTSDDTITGTRTYLATDLSGISTVNNTYEAVDHDGVYTAPAADAGEVICFAIDGNDGATSGWAHLDNFSLVRLSKVMPSVLPVQTTLTGNEIQIHFPTQDGVAYQAMYSNSLTNDSWILYKTVVGDGNTNQSHLLLPLQVSWCFSELFPRELKSRPESTSR